jgi:hypothetical protein
MNNQTSTTYQNVNSANQITGVLCNGKFRDHLTGNFPTAAAKMYSNVSKQTKHKQILSIWILQYLPVPTKMISPVNPNFQIVWAR